MPHDRDVDFDEWIRGQLQEQPGPEVPAPRARRPRHVGLALQVGGAVLAVGAVAAGLLSSGTVGASRVALPTHVTQELPANTWQGTPPPAGAPTAPVTPSPTSASPARALATGASHGPAPGASPGGETHGLAPSPATSSAAGSSQTFQLVGGTATISCSGSQVSLGTVTPNAGFQAETEWKDGGATVEVRFRSNTHESQLDAWCSEGQLQSQVQESSG